MNTANYQHWQITTDAELITWLWLDRQGESTNALSREVIDELAGILEDLHKQVPRGVVIASAKQSGFIAGADINEFTRLKDSGQAFELIRRGQGVMDQIEALECPTVAMINGFCLGGGLELALACRYRVALDEGKTRLGLPEVKLGIHPGFGGSVRATRLLGAPVAMDLMLTGRTVDARRAKRIGLVDHAVPERHLQRAVQQMILQNPPGYKLKGWQRYSNSNLLRPLLARMMLKQVMKKASPDHYPAPFALIDLWLKYGSNPREMLRAEAESVAQLITDDTAQNLIRIFFLQEKMKASGKLKDYRPTRVHVIGGGVMGGDIAAWCAYKGMQVTVQDRAHESLARVSQRAYQLFNKRLRQPRLIQGAMDRLTPDIHGYGLKHADVVIEAIFEDLKVKQDLFKEVEAQVAADTLLCTNTSSIPLEEIGAVLKRPGRLVGLHFFNPVAQMQLVEIVHGEGTEQKMVDRAASFTRQIDRLPLAVKSSPGFLVNRVLMPYLLEAVTLVEEGVSIRAIDKAALKFGMPMGPITLADTVGLDICYSVASNLSRHLGIAVPDRLKEMVENGQLGKKSGAGFYLYDRKGKAVKRNTTGDKGEDDLAERLLMRYINEAMACLREGIVADAELLDAGMVFGTGFAPFRGGPMHYSQSRGIDTIRQLMMSLTQTYGDRFKADPGWAKSPLEQGHG
jgi:3-hydroxyacyl-CoA dehydrogenase/enoyl-CoA hydratase/3-hydroxybutyryl-CoA epimerase